MLKTKAQVKHLIIILTVTCYSILLCFKCAKLQLQYKCVNTHILVRHMSFNRIYIDFVYFSYKCLSVHSEARFKHISDSKVIIKLYIKMYISPTYCKENILKFS